MDKAIETWTNAPTSTTTFKSFILSHSSTYIEASFAVCAATLLYCKLYCHCEWFYSDRSLQIFYYMMNHYLSAVPRPHAPS